MRKRGQSSVEYTVLVAFALVLILPIAYSFFTSAASDTKTENAQIQHFAEAVISQSERLYAMGPGAKAVISERLPKGAYVELKSDDATGTYELVITADGREYVYPTSVPINSSITAEDTAQGIASIRIEMKQRPNGEVYSWAAVDPPCTTSSMCSDDKFCMMEIGECAVCSAGDCVIQQSCYDGTFSGNCVVGFEPRYCNSEGALVPNCEQCCPSGTCGPDGACTTPPATETLTRRVSLGADDVARWGTGTTGISNAPPSCIAGNTGGANSYSFSCAMRFTNINIPKDSTITSAYLTFTARLSNPLGTVNSNLYAENVDNAAQISGTNSNDFDRSLTDPVAWVITEPWNTNAPYSSLSTSLVAPIQTVVNGADWVSGNAINIFWKDASSPAGVYRTAYSFEGTSNDQWRPLLTITYSPPTTLPCSDVTPLNCAVCCPLGLCTPDGEGACAITPEVCSYAELTYFCGGLDTLLGLSLGEGSAACCAEYNNCCP
ncbi:MAG: hypothetical protein V1702_05435 [Candidatus Woesearchaeota archaeon]